MTIAPDDRPARDPQAPRRSRRRRTALALAAAAATAVAVGLAPWLRSSAPQHARVIRWVREGAARHPDWRVTGGRACPGAPMVLPTDGFIGYGWDDRFRPGHRHTGLDIFSPDGAEDVTPVVAAYDGLLTRAPGWRSAVIIRHPDFPADFAPLAARPPAGGVIWTYYAHMASADGAHSFIDAAFPPGTRDRPVRAGERLGRQGMWSGDPARPVGLHLHVSIVEGTPEGGYADETDIARTYDPAPFFGLARGRDGVLRCAAGGAAGEAGGT